MNNNKILQNGLIVTFSILYLATAFVSFYHAIEFFNLSNERWLSVILSLVAEIGQATVLFSLLMSNNKSKLMPWVIMFILTALQVIGNVYSCYVFIEEAASPRFVYFHKSILFFLEESPETMKVVVAWITGSLLPIIALCLTSLVAENLHLSSKDYTLDTDNDDNTPNTEPSDEIEIHNTNETLYTAKGSVVDNTPVDVSAYEDEQTEIIVEPKQEATIETEKVATPIKKSKPRRKKIVEDKILTDTTVPNNKPSTNNIEVIQVK